MANADIRQLEMDGSVFYPQTDINGLVNNGEFAIDNEPIVGSENLVKSGGVASRIVSVSQNTLKKGEDFLFSSIEQLDFYKGTINWHIGYINSSGILVIDENWKYTPLFPKIVYDYFDISYISNGTQTNLYKNGQWAGYVNRTGWHDENGNVIQQEDADYDSWLFNIQIRLHPNYQLLFKVKTSLYDLTGGYTYAGIATLTNSPSLVANTFYFAQQIGVYENFGNIRVFDGESAILKYNGSSWSKETITNGRYTHPVVDLFEGSIDWQIGYDNGTSFTYHTDWRRTPIYPRSLFNAFNIIYPSGSGVTQTNLYKNSVMVGVINNTGWHQNGSSVVVDPYSIDFDSWLFNVQNSVFPNYESLITLRAKTIDLITYGETLTLLDKIVLDSSLTWIPDSYYNFKTGELIGNTSIYTCTIKYQKTLLNYFVSTDYIGETFLSLWNNNVYVGSYRWDGEYYDTTGAITSEPIDFDTFAVNVFISKDSNYLNKYTIKSLNNNTKNYSYYALGDSITQGAYADYYSYANYLNNKNKYTLFSNLAVGGATCMKYQTSGRLSAQVSQIPNGTTGLITVMIGVNDVAVVNTLGSASDALSATYESLDDETTFANAFRYNIETIKRNSPNANLVVLIPLRCKPLGQWPNATDEHLEAYREVEREICKALSVPYIDTDEECGISLLYNWSIFMADGFHPNSTGQERIAKYLINRIETYCGQLE